MLSKLYHKREATRDLVEQGTRAAYNLIKKEKYVGGNTPGKYLAKAIKKRKLLTILRKSRQQQGI